MSDEPDLLRRLLSAAGPPARRRPWRAPWDEQPDEPGRSWDEQPDDPDEIVGRERRGNGGRPGRATLEGP